MNLKNFFVLISFILVVLIAISGVAAIEDNNMGQDSLVISEESEYNLNDEILSVNDESKLSDSQVIPVDNIGETHREMNEHTIRDAIDSAEAGDTILINGAYYDHVHIVIDKQLTIKSNVGTVLSPCSSTATSGHQGVFYISPKASGTIIEGFTFVDDLGLSDNEAYGILVNKASDVTVRNCNISTGNSGNGIVLKNADNVLIQNNNIFNNEIGVEIIDSEGTEVTGNNLKNNDAAVSVSGSSSNQEIGFNNITNNKNGIELTSSDQINILSNYIAENTNHGIYVNCPITQINIIGNFFYKNLQEEIFNDGNTKGLYVKGGEKLQFINNNYFVGLGNRPVQRSDSAGGGVFLRYAFEINTNVACPIIYSSYNVNWYNSDFRLYLSEISQSKKGVYTISIVDSQGNVAKGLSSVPVIFYLNKNNNYVSPQEGDVYKTVMMVDGTATVRFYSEDFNESGNVVTAVLPGYSQYITGDQYSNVKTFNVDDSYIPGEITETKIIVSDLNTYPNSNIGYTITLLDVNNNPIVNETVICNFNSDTLYLKTDEKGQATIKINKNAGKYIIKVSYNGDDCDYKPSAAQALITVNKISTKIVSSNYAMLIKKTSYYQAVLKDSNGKVLSGQKITFKVNKKTYTVKTNSKGVAKIKLKLKKGTYKVVMNYNGNNVYSAAKKTNKIFVKKNLKTKLTAPKIKTTPKTSTKYTVTLKNQNGEAIKKQKITVNINGKKYTKKTNSKGQVTVKVKFSKLKTYNVKATYKGSKIYKKSKATGKITVQKIATVIAAPNMELHQTKSDLTTRLLCESKQVHQFCKQDY